MRSRASWTARYALLAASAALVGACSLMNTPKASVGGPLTTDAKTNELDAVKDPAVMASAKSSMDGFKALNSNDNFTMPIGNNFTMPIGNNFTMPIGNNFIGNAGSGLVGNAGSGYRIQDATVSARVVLGFVPTPADSVFATSSNVVTLPASGSAAQTGTIRSGDSKFDALVSLGWWDDACGSIGQAGCEGYEDTLTYKALSVPVAGEERSLKGSYKLRLSGPNTTGNWPPPANTDKYGGLMLLGINANPKTISHRQEEYDLKTNDSDAKQVAKLTVDQTEFKAYDIAIPKNSSQDARNVSIQVPQRVAVSGALIAPAGKALGINLQATADFTAKTFTLGGWLRSCDTYSDSSPCATTDASSSVGAAGEIREDYELDFEAATSKLTFTLATDQTDWPKLRVTMRYDYGVALVLGKPGGSLTGDIWYLDTAGNPASGGKVATIEADSSGNPVIKFLDGNTTTWKIN